MPVDGIKYGTPSPAAICPVQTWGHTLDHCSQSRLKSTESLLKKVSALKCGQLNWMIFEKHAAGVCERAMVGWKSTEWLYDHRKGGVTRCTAMMSSIGVLCGSLTCYSFVNQVCAPALLCLTPNNISNHCLWLSEAKKLIGGSSHTNMRKPQPLPVLVMLQLH